MIYETDDLHEAAYLLTRGCEMIDVSKERRGKVIFTIEGEKIKELCENYYNGSASINVSEYLHCLKRAKDCMFAVLRATRIIKMK
jgi:hypothetical protein